MSTYKYPVAPRHTFGEMFFGGEMGNVIPRYHVLLFFNEAANVFFSFSTRKR